MNYQKDKKSLRLSLIVGVGAILRLFYVVFSTIYERQYDIGMIDINAGHTVSGGHLAYIQYFYHNMSMPDFDPTSVYQFHHPPLHHFVSALWMRFVSLFTDNSAVIEESIQIVPLVCSVVTLIFLYKIVKEFNLSFRAAAFIMTIFAFHPSFVLLSGSVNNDCMALMFTVMVCFYTMKWAKTKDLKHIIAIALCLGLGMSTKQNVAEMAFPIGFVFLYVFIKEIRKDKHTLSRFIKQFIIFLAIAAPLGMWFYVRNLIRFDMSMLWVYELPTDSWQYTGNVPVINRFLWPDISEMIDNLKNFKIGCGYNVWVEIMRTSVLGEWDMAGVGATVKLISVLLMFFGGILAIFALMGFVKVFVGSLVKKDKYHIDRTNSVFFLLAYVTTMVFYLSFAYKYPQQCSMNFRYITIAVLFPAIGAGVWYDKTKSQILRSVIGICLIGFVSLSIFMTIIWCFGV